ncbi:MAG: FGGY family carbohydrate kinase [Lachnoclostridium sp.]|nr:FGGY family carbohydrate kinase [Lachnoclostridium sp.]
MKLQFLAVDLGVSGGQTLIGTLNEDDNVKVETLTRFPLDTVSIGNHIFWNLPHIYLEIEKALSIVASRGIKLTSIGIDSWGADFVCFGEDGYPLANPLSFHDPCTAGEPSRFFAEKISAEKVYDITGQQAMNYNSLFQLSAMQRANNSALAAARRIMFLPDALSFLLCGMEVTEYTIASSSQLLNPKSRRIDPALLEALNLPTDIFPPIVMPGTVIGRLSSHVSRRTGMPQIPVVAVAGHDIASAIAAIPADGHRFAFLRSGLRSIMGIELPDPVIDDDSCVANFSNQAGAESSSLLIKHLCGLSILERCRNEWQRDGKPTDYDSLLKASLSVNESGKSLIAPEAPEFANPTSMIDAIRQYCRASGQGVPESQGKIVDCILVSLAMRYRQVLSMLRHFAPFDIDTLHIIGKGSIIDRLNRLTADILQIRVIAGPAENTSTGNLMLQAKAAGRVRSLDEIRTLIRHSAKVKEYAPDPSTAQRWDSIYSRFNSLPK